MVLNDQAINITLCTYQDKVDFCLVACRKTLPNVEKILDYMAVELAIFNEMFIH